MVEEKLVTVLKASSDLVNLVSSRIFPVLLPQDAAFPSVTYQRVSGERVYDLDGDSNLENPRIQIDTWSTSYGASKQISGIIRTAMEGSATFDALLLSDMDLYQDDVEIYRISQDFSIWNRE
ncbi:MAG: DUF3168 domain-containing protein [Thermodesulfobacteriota bacterium]|nr:DUF3168 domain-containing protein [Thermodesulfobacteriota bacterium]